MFPTIPAQFHSAHHVLPHHHPRHCHRDLDLVVAVVVVVVVVVRGTRYGGDTMGGRRRATGEHIYDFNFNTD